jgi:hypothetical protein
MALMVHYILVSVLSKIVTMSLSHIKLDLFPGRDCDFLTLIYFYEITGRYTMWG